MSTKLISKGNFLYNDKFFMVHKILNRSKLTIFLFSLGRYEIIKKKKILFHKLGHILFYYLILVFIYFFLFIYRTHIYTRFEKLNGNCIYSWKKKLTCICQQLAYIVPLIRTTTNLILRGVQNF